MYTFQEIVTKLNEFWMKQDCIICQPYDVEKGAGTFNPATFLRCLGPEPFRAAYIEPCRRPKDGRYGTNPNRLQHFFQYQVILKPSPYNIQDLYLQSLEAIGLPLSRHDIRFVHDDWESPTLGAWGLGWEVWVDGQECSQFTYFQAVAGIPLEPITGEITYGIERLTMYLQNVDSIFDIQWTDKLTYGDLYLRNEVEWSHYNFEAADAKMWFKHFEDYEREAKRLVAMNLPIPAYDFVIKASHAFNLLDARGVISVTERASYIANIRDIAKTVAEGYIASRKEQGFPLLKKLSSALEKPAEHIAKADIKHYDTPQDFLLEIGTEELPATFVDIGLHHLERLIKKLFEEQGISYKSVKTMGTPRRLAILVEALAPGKAATTTEKKGPALDHAFQAGGEGEGEGEGQVTAAGVGFFRQIGKPPLSKKEIQAGAYPEISIRDIKGTNYLFATITHAATNTIELLQKTLPELILKVDFPKKMRWADLSISFARPIRWIVALYGENVVQMAVGPIHSGNVSMGHRQLAPEAVTIQSAAVYRDAMKSKYVLVDITERQKEIERQLHELELSTGSKIVARERVIPQVVQLVEWPFLTITQFDKNFLKAPQEVLISEMVEHQKYFPVADKDGKLKNEFVITANTQPTDSIRHGNRKVISARLSDGVFLYEQDLKTPLVNFNEKLRAVTFQKGLGSVYDKVERLQRHVRTVAPYVPAVNLNDAVEAALLSKADLATEMVGEFPELQGEIGRIYAEKQGKSQAVSMAIDEQWMPRKEGAPLPQTACGIVLSLADKLDNLLGFFALNLKPTSSSDPYALRRAGLGLIRILIHHRISLPLEKVLKECLQAYPAELQKNGDTVQEIMTFLVARAQSVLQDLGFFKGEIEACLSIRTDDFYDIFQRLQALHDFRKQNASFSSLIEVHKRCQGQINGLKRLAFSQQLMQEPEEKALYAAFHEKTTEFLKAIQNKEYTRAFHLLSGLQQPLAALFDKVKILADDEQLRTNRLALLQEVATLFSAVADFQKIQEK